MKKVLIILGFLLLIEDVSAGKVVKTIETPKIENAIGLTTQTLMKELVAKKSCIIDINAGGMITENVAIFLVEKTSCETKKKEHLLFVLQSSENGWKLNQQVNVEIPNADDTHPFLLGFNEKTVLVRSYAPPGKILPSKTFTFDNGELK